jgi:hypothetical protein
MTKYGLTHCPLPTACSRSAPARTLAIASRLNTLASGAIIVIAWGDERRIFGQATVCQRNVSERGLDRITGSAGSTGMVEKEEADSADKK